MEASSRSGEPGCTLTLIHHSIFTQSWLRLRYLMVRWSSLRGWLLVRVEICHTSPKQRPMYCFPCTRAFLELTIGWSKQQKYESVRGCTNISQSIQNSYVHTFLCTWSCRIHCCVLVLKYQVFNPSPPLPLPSSNVPLNRLQFLINPFSPYHSYNIKVSFVTFFLHDLITTCNNCLTYVWWINSEGLTQL